MNGPGPVLVDLTGLRALSRGMRSVDRAAGRSVSKALRTASQVVATEARSRASWSSRIPGSVRVSATQTRARVTAGGVKAPHAKPYEGDGTPGVFRHPVYGRDAWVSQQRRPYLWPAALAKADEFAEVMADGLLAAVRSLGA